MAFITWKQNSISHHCSDAICHMCAGRWCVYNNQAIKNTAVFWDAFTWNKKWVWECCKHHYGMQMILQCNSQKIQGVFAVIFNKQHWMWHKYDTISACTWSIVKGEGATRQGTYLLTIGHSSDSCFPYSIVCTQTDSVSSPSLIKRQTSCGSVLWW